MEKPLNMSKFKENQAVKFKKKFIKNLFMNEYDDSDLSGFSMFLTKKSNNKLAKALRDKYFKNVEHIINNIDNVIGTVPKNKKFKLNLNIELDLDMSELFCEEDDIESVSEVEFNKELKDLLK